MLLLALLVSVCLIFLCGADDGNRASDVSLLKSAELRSERLVPLGNAPPVLDRTAVAEKRVAIYVIAETSEAPDASDPDAAGDTLEALVQEMAFRGALASLRGAISRSDKHFSEGAEEHLMRDVILLCAASRRSPGLREETKWTLWRVLQRSEWPPGASASPLSLTSWERIQLLSAAVLARIAAEAAKEPVLELYKRSSSPIMWARLEAVLPDVGIEAPGRELPPEELERRKVVSKQAATVAQGKVQEACDELRYRLGRAPAITKYDEPNAVEGASLIREWVPPEPFNANEKRWPGQREEWVPHERFNANEKRWPGQRENISDFLDAIREAGAASALVSAGEREELGRLLVAMLLLDYESLDSLWPHRGLGSVDVVHEALRRELKDMPADCHALRKIWQLREVWRREHDYPGKRMVAADLQTMGIVLAKREITGTAALAPRSLSEEISEACGKEYFDLKAQLLGTEGAEDILKGLLADEELPAQQRLLVRAMLDELSEPEQYAALVRDLACRADAYFESAPTQARRQMYFDSPKELPEGSEAAVFYRSLAGHEGLLAEVVLKHSLETIAQEALQGRLISLEERLREEEAGASEQEKEGLRVHYERAVAWQKRVFKQRDDRERLVRLVSAQRLAARALVLVGDADAVALLEHMGRDRVTWMVPPSCLVWIGTPAAIQAIKRLDTPAAREALKRLRDK